MRRVFFLVALTILGCGKAVDHDKAAAPDSARTSAAVRPPVHDLISCDGIGDIRLEDDLNALIRKAGRDQVSHDSLFLEGNYERMITRVRKGTPREVLVYWKEKEEPFRTIQTLEISSRTSPYHFSNGINIGTSLKKIVELNGGVPVSLYGFGWDYGGTFISFRNGELTGPMECFGGVFQLTSTDIVTSELKKVMGDHEIRSDYEALKQYQALLVKIRVSRPESKTGTAAEKPGV